MTERSGAEVRSDDDDHTTSDDSDLGSRTDEPDTVQVVVAHDTPPGRFMPQPVVREVPREAQADWDERYWERPRRTHPAS